MNNYNSVLAMDKLSVLKSTRRRLQFIAIVTMIMGFITCGVSLSVYDWACQRIENYDQESNGTGTGTGGTVDFDVNCQGGTFNCHGREAWISTSILAVIAGVYQAISSIFLFRSALGMRSWIVGNLLMAAFSVYFACFILKAFPNLMGVYLCNLIVLIVCSLIGYFVKNMRAFEESSMSLLS